MNNQASTLRELELEGALRRLLSGTKKLAQAVDAAGLPAGYTNEDLNELGCAEHEADVLLPPVSGRLRRVEMYAATKYGGDNGEWNVWDVFVPLETPEHLIPAVAEKLLLEEHKAVQGQELAFYGVYNVGEVICTDPDCGEEVMSGDFCGHGDQHALCCPNDVHFEVLGYHTRADFDAGNFVTIEPGVATMAEAAHIAKESLDHFAVTKAQSSDREEIEIFGDKD